MFAAKRPKNLGEYMEQHIAAFPRFYELLPYESYDPTTQLFYNQDATGFVLLANPIVGSSLDDQQQIAEFFRQNAHLYEGASLQFLLFASPHIGGYLDNWRDSRIEASKANPIFHKLASNRSELLKAKAFEDVSGFPVRDFRLLISYTLPGHKSSSVEQDHILMFRRELRAILEGMGVHSNILDAEGLIREVGSILNIEEGEVYPYFGQWNEHNSISRSLTDTKRTYHIQEGQVLLNDGKTVCRSYVPSVAPKIWALGYMDRMIGDCLERSHTIGCPYLIHYGFYVNKGQSRLKGKAIAKRESLEKSLQGNLSKFIPDLADQYSESIEVAAELQAGGQVITSSLSYTVFSTPANIQEHEQQLRKIWGRGGWSFQPARYDHLTVLLASLPMTWTLGYKKGLLFKKPFGMATDLLKLSKAKITITKEAQNLLPIVAEWKGQAAPGMPLIGRRGQLFFWNPFDKLLTSKNPKDQLDHDSNISIAGLPGSGKSFFLNSLMDTIMGVGGKAVVLDLGRSFKKNCQVLGGRHIEFDVRYPISLNPFTHIPMGNTLEETEIRSDMLACVGPMFQVMAAPKQGTTDLENAFLDQAIRYSWEKYQTGSNVDTVREYLLNHENLAARDVGEKLSSFGGKGTFGHFFNDPANSDLKEDLIVIETEPLRSYPTLLAVVVQMLIMQVNQQMAKGCRARPFIIIIDEAWLLLGGKNTAAFIAEASRIVRKYRGAIICATQHLTDYFKPEAPGATEAFNCSAWKCILRQEGDVITSLKSHPQLQAYAEDEYKEALLRSIHSNPPHYSEIALFGPGIHGIVGRLRVDSFSRLLYSTNPQEYQIIESLIKQGFSIENAIEELIKMQEGGATNG